MERLPERDPDEQLKLARWCLTNHFNAEAKTHLQAVLDLSPKHGPALAMLDSLIKNEERAALRDPAVGRTNLEVTDDRPRELNPRDLRKSQRLPGLANVNPGLPRVFDLPPPVAVKRANEFAQYVQPVLQVACAKCHNEQYSGEFQLIEIKTKHDRTSDVYRANLDATLRLVDPDNPSRSELLSSALRNHGNGKLKRPIFTGANDPYYQVLATWVNNLRSAKAKEPVLQAGRAAPAEAQPDEEVFAVDRNGRGAMVSSNAPRQLPPATRESFPTIPAAQGAPSDDRFPVPFMLGGPKPKLDLPPQSPARTPIPLPVRPGPARPELPALPPETDDDELPPPPPKSLGKSPAKPVKIDPALLQRALQNRYAPQ